jgi:hypothetical protein
MVLVPEIFIIYENSSKIWIDVKKNIFMFSIVNIYEFIIIWSFNIFMWILVNVNRVDFDQLKKQDILMDRRVCKYLYICLY